MPQKPVFQLEKEETHIYYPIFYEVFIRAYSLSLSLSLSLKLCEKSDGMVNIP
jgi:hypothetical protein